MRELRKSKVSTVVIQIKRSGLRVSKYKVSSSCFIIRFVILTFGIMKQIQGNQGIDWICLLFKWKKKISSKVIMQGKLIAVAFTLRTYWNRFSLGGICKQESSVFDPRRIKALNFKKFDDSHNSFLWPEYFIDYLCERWIPCQAVTSVLCFITAQRQYTTVQKMRTPLK